MLFLLLFVNDNDEILYKGVRLMDAEVFLREKLKLTDEDLIKAIINNSEILHFKKGEAISVQGKPAPHLDILMNDGLVIGYYKEEETGKQVMECFGTNAGQCISDSFDSQEAWEHVSFLTIKAMEDISVLRFLRKKAAELAEMYKEGQTLAYHLLYESGRYHLSFQRLLVTYKGEELVQQFEKEYPEVAAKLDAPEIASLLNVSERTVYRSRK